MDLYLELGKEEENCLENRFILLVLIIVSKIQTQSYSAANHNGARFFEAVAVILAEKINALNCDREGCTLQ